MYLSSFFLLLALACSNAQLGSTGLFISDPKDKVTFVEAIKKCLSRGMVPADYMNVVHVKNKKVDIDSYLLPEYPQETSQNFWVNPYDTNGDLSYWQTKLGTVPLVCKKLAYNSGASYQLEDELCKLKYQYVCLLPSTRSSLKSLRDKVKNTYHEIKKWMKNKLKKTGHYTEEKLSKFMDWSQHAYHDLKDAIGNAVEFSKEQAEILLDKLKKKFEKSEKHRRLEPRS